MDDSDQQEISNIQEERTFVEHMESLVENLATESKNLSKEYKTLSKKSKDILKILKKKESKNQNELKAMLKFKNNNDVASMTKDANKLKSDEAEEKALSYKEAELLQQMLKDLQDAHNRAFQIMSTDRELHDLIRNTYQKDLDDFQLETSNLDKA